MATLASAKRRHPANGWQPDMSRMTDVMAERLRGEGHPWPELAALLLAERGRLGLDLAGYAAVVGVAVEVLASLEDGAPWPLGSGVTVAGTLSSELKRGTLASVLRQAGLRGTGS